MATGEVPGEVLGHQGQPSFGLPLVAADQRPVQPGHLLAQAGVVDQRCVHRRADHAGAGRGVVVPSSS